MNLKHLLNSHQAIMRFLSCSLLIVLNWPSTSCHMVWIYVLLVSDLGHAAGNMHLWWMKGGHCGRSPLPSRTCIWSYLVYVAGKVAGVTKLQAYCLQCCKSQKRNISDTWKMLGLTIMRPKCWDHYFEHRCQEKMCVHRQKAKHLCTWHNSVAISSGSYRHLKSRASTGSHHPI